MVKIGLEINDNGDNINIKLIDPTKKQLEDATANEKIVAQKIKDLFDTKLIELLTESEED